MVLLEASVLKKPMISCEIRAASFINLHEEIGFVVPAEAPESPAGTVQSLLKDEALVNKMGLAAHSRYDQLFSGPALGQAYASLYKELL